MEATGMAMENMLKSLMPFKLKTDSHTVHTVFVLVVVVVFTRFAL